MVQIKDVNSTNARSNRHVTFSNGPTKHPRMEDHHQERDELDRVHHRRQRRITFQMHGNLATMLGTRHRVVSSFDCILQKNVDSRGVLTMLFNFRPSTSKMWRMQTRRTYTKQMSPDTGNAPINHSASYHGFHYIKIFCNINFS